MPVDKINLIEALKQIEQMSDCGSPETAIVRMKSIATEALKTQSLTVSNGVEAIEFAEWILYSDYEKCCDNKNMWYEDSTQERPYSTQQLYELFKNK